MSFFRSSGGGGPPPGGMPPNSYSRVPAGQYNDPPPSNRQSPAQGRRVPPPRSGELFEKRSVDRAPSPYAAQYTQQSSHAGAR